MSSIDNIERTEGEGVGRVHVLHEGVYGMMRG